MKKIKKMVAMLMIVAIMFGGMVFGASGDTANFTINTKVAGVAQIGIFSDPKTNNANFSTENNTVSITLTNGTSNRY